MLKGIACSVVILCLAGLAGANDSPANANQIRFPPAPAVAPVTPPAPDAVTVIASDEFFVIDSDVELFVLCSPPSLVTIAADAGPQKVKAKFTGGTGKVETRTFAGKFLYFVEAKGAGTGELIVIPKGVGAEKDIIRKAIAANIAPQPPPVPPGPGPQPPPGPPVPVTSFRVIFVYETADKLTPSQRGIIFGKAVEDYLNANCTGGKNGWRRRDKDAPGENDATMKALWDAVRPEFVAPKNTPTPAVAIEVNGRVEIVSMPATPADMVALLKKYNGGK